MRSVASIFVDCLLIVTKRKKRLADRAVFDHRVQNLLAQGETPYELAYDKFSVDVQKAMLNGMEYYILRSDNKTNPNKIMYFHGGGFISQPIAQHWKMLNTIAGDTGAEIWVPVYPKIPYHTAAEVYPLLHKLYAMFANSVGDDGHMILMGDSAGGNMVLSMAEQLKKLPVRQPSELIMISPYLDATLPSPDTEKIDPKDLMLGIYGTHRCGELWAGETALDDPVISPLNGDINGLGFMTVFTGTHDIINPDTHRLLEKAQLLRIPMDLIEVKKMQHVYPLLPIPEAKRAIRTIEAIVMGKPEE